MSQHEEGNKRKAVSKEQCTLIFMTIYLPRGVSPSHLASLASETALCWRRKYNRGEEVVLKTGPRALQRHLPSSPGTRDSEGGMGRLRREVQWYLFLKDITVSTETTSEHLESAVNSAVEWASGQSGTPRHCVLLLAVCFCVHGLYIWPSQ